MWAKHEECPDQSNSYGAVYQEQDFLQLEVVEKTLSSLDHWVTVAPFDDRDNKGQRKSRFGGKMMSSMLDILNLMSGK